MRIDIVDRNDDATATNITFRFNYNDSTSANMQLNAMTSNAQALRETKGITQPPRSDQNIRIGQLRNDWPRSHRAIR